MAKELGLGLGIELSVWRAFLLVATTRLKGIGHAEKAYNVVCSDLPWTLPLFKMLGVDGSGQVMSVLSLVRFLCSRMVPGFARRSYPLSLP